MHFIPNRYDYADILFKTLRDERRFSSSEYSMSAEPSLTERLPEDTTDTGRLSTGESPVKALGSATRLASLQTQMQDREGRL